ncbi:hypothetical protein EXIGLDRAFT_783233 [Exidia glandulosa HHB12029]|uniref:Uncharacterized protein n=1 Tax=Exidia glandulosa HHB12029 TaxID=1314781 RepID=A0A166N6J5_EXIGL|nr:hypothetical protein EXIGLDRAFT_783233 [Exidia glandulosa HHB12029]
MPRILNAKQAAAVTAPQEPVVVGFPYTLVSVMNEGPLLANDYGQVVASSGSTPTGPWSFITAEEEGTYKIYSFQYRKFVVNGDVQSGDHVLLGPNSEDPVVFNVYGVGDNRIVIKSAKSDLWWTISCFGEDGSQPDDIIYTPFEPQKDTQLLRLETFHKQA